MQELPSYFCASLCQVLEATAIQHLQAFPFNLHASLCQRLEATCTPHLQAPSSNLCASLCQRLEATGSTGTKHLQAVASNISAYLRQRLEATCKQRFMNSDTLWHVPMLLLAKLPTDDRRPPAPPTGPTILGCWQHAQAPGANAREPTHARGFGGAPHKAPTVARL